MNEPKTKRRFYAYTLLFLLGLVAFFNLNAQPIKGIVVNGFTKEPVVFASVYWKRANKGCITDSLGQFFLNKSPFTSDTIMVDYVGFEKLKYPFIAQKVSSDLVLFLSETRMSEGAIVKTKFNKGLRWWKQVVANKEKNNPYQYRNYSYELYSKLELDLANFNKKTLSDKKVLKPFDFIFKNIDSTSDAAPFLPVYIAEALSNYYTSNDPYKVKEEIKATQTSGIKNETVLQLIGGVNQKINSYNNFMMLFGKEFVSPLSNIGDKFYNYKGADTQTINNQKYFHLLFTPKQVGSNTFTGDCWIHANTWAVQKINLTASATANINYVHRLSVVQEFTRVNDSTWIFLKDKTVVDISPFSKEKFSFIGRRTATYKNVQINQYSTDSILAKNNKPVVVIITDEAKLQSSKYWTGMRHESLSSNELKVYQMIDTLKQMPIFQTYKSRLEFIFGGYKKLGMIEIGPWYKWISSNELEDLRLRFDIGTTEKFSKNIRLYGYGAYGFGDARWKGKFGFHYKFKKQYGWNFGASYTDDLDNGRIRFIDDENATIDNIFNRLLRRKGLPQKFLGLQELRAYFGKDWSNNLSAKTSFIHSSFETYQPLPHSRFFTNKNHRVINSEFGIKLRYAPGERSIVGSRKDIRLKTHLPIIDLEYAFAVPDVMSSEYKYQKIGVNLSQRIRVNRWGQVDYMLYGGQVFGEGIPFMLLEVHPGNEIYYYNKQSFNLMNRFEYISDRFVGFNIEHNFEKKLFQLIPFMRKTKMRQFWNVKTVWGEVNRANRITNRTEFGGYYLKTLRGDMYTEVGTGIDNIFKFFRIDLVWRILPNHSIPLPPSARTQTINFGVFGSFRLQF